MIDCLLCGSYGHCSDMLQEFHPAAAQQLQRMIDTKKTPDGRDLEAYELEYIQAELDARELKRKQK